MLTLRGGLGGAETGMSCGGNMGETAA